MCHLSAAFGVVQGFGKEPHLIARSVDGDLSMISVYKLLETLQIFSRCWWACSHTCILLLKQLSTVDESVWLAFHGNKAGWYPRMHWNGVSLVAECLREFCAYSAHGRNHLSLKKSSMEGVRFFKKKAAVLSLGFSLNLCERTAQACISNGTTYSTSTINGSEGSGCFSIGAEVNASLILEKGCSTDGVHCNCLFPFLSKVVSGDAMMLKLFIYYQYMLVNPTKCCSSLTVVRTGQFVTAETFSWSMSNLSGPVMLPINVTLCMWNLHSSPLT